MWWERGWGESVGLMVSTFGSFFLSSRGSGVSSLIFLSLKDDVLRVDLFVFFHFFHFFYCLNGKIAEHLSAMHSTLSSGWGCGEFIDSGFEVVQYLNHIVGIKI